MVVSPNIHFQKWLFRVPGSFKQTLFQKWHEHISTTQNKGRVRKNSCINIANWKYPWTPKPWKMKVLHPKIWVITPKNAGFRFPWYRVILSFLCSKWDVVLGCWKIGCDWLCWWFLLNRHTVNILPKTHVSYISHWILPYTVSPIFHSKKMPTKNVDMTSTQLKILNSTWPNFHSRGQPQNNAPEIRLR